VFGVPLTSSIRYAKTSVGYVDEDGVKHSRAGSIPIVVAKCGSFLKQQGTDIFKQFAYTNLSGEGIFRVSGSIKRVNELEFSFDSSASHYGLDFSWEGYTVHDAANLLTRYLNKLPNSVIPFESYHDFRDTISKITYTDTELKVEHFQSLIRKLPIAHQHLLLYLLDLLSLFASNSEQTKMSISNLAAIFCPSLIRHPNYNSPDEYKISQCAIEFLIEYQSLFTMQV
ncbi:Rho GTPase activation protein, partial [Sporodiniella umbellata]